MVVLETLLSYRDKKIKKLKLIQSSISTKDSIIMRLVAKKFAEIATDKMQLIPNSHAVYLGRIDGESYPFRFIDRKTEPEKQIEHSWK